MNVFQLIRRIEVRVDLQIEQFFYHHSFLGYLFLLIVIPLISLMMLFTGCVILTFPFALLLGWL